jgi:hypothetical protein
MNVLLVEAAGAELFSVLITRKLLIPGTATTAKKAPIARSIVRLLYENTFGRGIETDAAAPSIPQFPARLFEKNTRLTSVETAPVLCCWFESRRSPKLGLWHRRDHRTLPSSPVLPFFGSRQPYASLGACRRVRWNQRALLTAGTGPCLKFPEPSHPSRT